MPVYVCMYVNMHSYTCTCTYKHTTHTVYYVVYYICTCILYMHSYLCVLAYMCKYWYFVPPQVVVGSEGSTVTVWDIDTGRKVLHFPHCHGDHEITCMVVDRDGRRFITGTRYGEVKVWNSTTGECLKVLHHAHKTEVTGVVGVADKRQILTVGWNKQVTVFPDDEDVSQWYLRLHTYVCTYVCVSAYVCTYVRSCMDLL